MLLQNNFIISCQHCKERDSTQNSGFPTVLKVRDWQLWASNSWGQELTLDWATPLQLQQSLLSQPLHISYLDPLTLIWVTLGYMETQQRWFRGGGLQVEINYFISFGKVIKRQEGRTGEERGEKRGTERNCSGEIGNRNRNTEKVGSFHFSYNIVTV